ncbi:hypothetical protein D8674_033010 [Pyrus ussuriensis x Pyrus communis]|uniref:Auxin-induced protein 6B-like n=1 Tax=Pyrus ussuriensis x Pyrus communis TaxID=2448454 RepID=A0A5N5HK55_9ROSA|nr:hypothetical protein D8674_033010 [Pyrus ussuriensis x Pyrus communis]
MSDGLGKCSKIRHIVRLRQLLRRWRSKACTSTKRIPSDVPAGHVAVCVGTSCTRFVVRASYLNHPVFKKLLVQAEEEYGFSNSGPLAIPCDESLFEEVLRFISRSESRKSTRLVNVDDFQKYCHVGARSNLELWADSRPLLRGFSEKTICRVAELRMHEAPKNAMEMATEWVSQSTESSRVRIGAEAEFVIEFSELKRAAEEEDD